MREHIKQKLAVILAASVAAAVRLARLVAPQSSTFTNSSTHSVPSYHANGRLDNHKHRIIRMYAIPAKAVYFFEMSVLLETGELNTYVYDSGGLALPTEIRIGQKARGQQRRSLSRTESFSRA